MTFETIKNLFQLLNTSLPGSKIFGEHEEEQKQLSVPYYQRIGVLTKSKVKISEAEILPYTVKVRKISNNKFEHIIHIRNTGTNIRYVTCLMDEIMGWELDAGSGCSIIVPFASQRYAFDFEIRPGTYAPLFLKYQPCDEGNGKDAKLVIDFYRNRDVDGETGVQTMEIMLKGSEAGTDLTSSCYQFIDENSMPTSEIFFSKVKK